MGCICTQPVNEPIPISIIFLDVDGVLNTVETRLSKTIGDTQLKQLNYILTNTQYDTKIVLSSNWRKHRNSRKLFFNTLKSYFNIKNINDLIIGVTPTLRRAKRAIEINEYFKINENSLNKIYIIKSWVVLDDMNLDKPNAQCQQIMNGHFIKIDRKYGLTIDDAKRAVSLLNMSETLMHTHKIQSSNDEVF
eukprot:35469_1